MKKNSSFFKHVTKALFFILWALIPLKLQAAEPIHFELRGEKIELKTDGRVWTKGFRDIQEAKGFIEFVLPDETAENWTERITINYFTGLQGEDLLERFTTFTKNGLNQQCRHVEWENLDKKEKSLIYQWSADQCKEWPKQSEIARVIVGNEGLYVLQYASKSVPIPADKSSTWYSLLQKVKVSTS